eukprot:4734914-Amphidinium_carterae.1
MANPPRSAMASESERWSTLHAHVTSEVLGGMSSTEILASSNKMFHVRERCALSRLFKGKAGLTNT